MFVITVGLVFGPLVVVASPTEGTIDQIHKWAWSENSGWINFGASGGNVRVTDTVLTGYAWSDTYGWINLAPQEGGVTNTSEGVLGGHAWGENAGYIDFTGVTINGSGFFLGFASSTVLGRISFNCSNTDTCIYSDFKVRTDWRPKSIRDIGNGGGIFIGPLPGGGGGGGSGNTASPLEEETAQPEVATATTTEPEMGESSEGTGEQKTEKQNGGKEKISCGEYLSSFIKYGVQNNPQEVEKLQTFLNTWENAGVSVTKIYDTPSFMAVKRFQEKHREHVLVPWGIEGPTGYVYLTTKKRINELVCDVLDRVDVRLIGKPLRYGESGSEVRALQRALNILGFAVADEGPGSPGEETEYFGPLTRDAVVRFQDASVFLGVTGIVGKDTQEAINLDLLQESVQER